MDSEFWNLANLRFAVIFTAVLYWLGIYIFLLPAYVERLRHPRLIALRRVGLSQRTNLYTLIFIFAPLIFLFLLFSIVALGILSLFSVIMLMAMSPFHWLLSKLPFDPHFSIMKPWKRMGGRMFEHSRKLFVFLLGEQSLQEMTPLQDESERQK